jgi:uncharacterized protein with von Willebrand factor type A (vWA) domain
MHIRYSRWDDNRRDGLNSEEVFDQLNDYMNDTGDLQQAMRRLMQKGLKQGEKQTKGIDDLLSQIAKEMRKMYDEYKLQSAMDEVQEQLDHALDRVLYILGRRPFRDIAVALMDAVETTLTKRLQR